MLLTGSEEAVHPQEVEGDSHDSRFVQVGGDSTGEWQSAGELIKHLRLLTPPTSSRITRTQLPLLRTGPTGGGGAAGVNTEGQDTINRDENMDRRGGKSKRRKVNDRNKKEVKGGWKGGVRERQWRRRKKENKISIRCHKTKKWKKTLINIL